MNVLKAEQFARMQRRKDDERMLVSDIYIYIHIYLFGSKDLCCFECHMIVIICCSKFHTIVLEVE
jgi:hypothetical protein